MENQTSIINVDAELDRLQDLWLQEEIEWIVLKDYVRDHFDYRKVDWPRIQAGLDEVLARVMANELKLFEATTEAIKAVVAAPPPLKTKEPSFSGLRLVWSQ